MKAIKYVSMAAIALTVTACSNDNETDNWAGEIRLSSGVSTQQTVTRSIATDVQSEQIANGNHAGFFINEDVTSGATTTYTQNLDYTANGSGSFNGTTVYFPQSGNGVNIYAYAPYKADLALNGNYPFTVAADQSTDDGYVASDLLWGQPMKKKAGSDTEYETANPVARTSSAVNVTFQHLLSKIQVTLEAGAGLEAADFKGATLFILNTQPGISLALSSGAITGLTGTATEITAAKYSTSETPAALTASAIVVPQTITAGTNFMKLHLATGGDLYYKIPDGGLTLAGGNIYKYTITVKLTELTVTSTITPWGTIGNGDPVPGTAVMQ